MKFSNLFLMTSKLEDVKEQLSGWRDFEFEVETFEDSLVVKLGDGWEFEASQVADNLDGRVVDGSSVWFELK